jgi:hypothetical protein
MLLDQLRALATDDPDFFSDLIEGETNLLELIAALDASIVDDGTLVDGEPSQPLLRPRPAKASVCARASSRY